MLNVVQLFFVGPAGFRKYDIRRKIVMAVNNVKKAAIAKLRRFLAEFNPQFLRDKAVVINTFSDGVCNSKCSWCTTQYKSVMERSIVGKLPFSSFKNFLQLNSENKFPLIPYGAGEPTIHKEFVPFCRYALDEGWTIEFVHSNLSSPSLSDDVLDVITEFKSVLINFGGGTKETQYLNMKTDLDVTFDNLKRLLEAKAANKSSLKINARMILNKRNITEADLLKQKIKQISTDIDFRATPLYFSVSDGSPADKKRFFEANLATSTGEVDARVPCREKVFLDETGDIHSTSKLKICYGLIPTVHYNGDVMVCCRTRWYGGVVGNAFKEPMKDIINSKKYKKAEKLALKRKYVECCKFCS